MRTRLPSGSSPPPPRRDRKLVVAALVGGTGGLGLALLLRMAIASTPVPVNSYALRWLTLMLGIVGAVAALAVESVRQLQEANPDPAYHRRGGRGRSRRGPDA